MQIKEQAHGVAVLNVGLGNTPNMKETTTEKIIAVLAFIIALGIIFILGAMIQK